MRADDGNEIEEIYRKPRLRIDWEVYTSYLEDTDLDDDQKRELIEAICYIMWTFVDLGFGLDPAQQALSLESKRRADPVDAGSKTRGESLKSTHKRATLTNKQKGDFEERNTR